MKDDTADRAHARLAPGTDPGTLPGVNKGLLRRLQELIPVRAIGHAFTPASPDCRCLDEPLLDMDSAGPEAIEMMACTLAHCSAEPSHVRQTREDRLKTFSEVIHHGTGLGTVQSSIQDDGAVTLRITMNRRGYASVEHPALRTLLASACRLFLATLWPWRAVIAQTTPEGVLAACIPNGGCSA